MKTYVADLMYFGQIIVELKALERLSSREEAQILLGVTQLLSE